MEFDLQNISEVILLEDINTRVNILIKAINKYLVYKVWTANKETTCGELAGETKHIKNLLDVLVEYKDGLEN